MEKINMKSDVSRYKVIKDMEHEEIGYINIRSLWRNTIEKTKKDIYFLFHNESVSKDERDVSERINWLKNSFTVKIQCVIQNNIKKYKIYGSPVISRISSTSYRKNDISLLLKWKETIIPPNESQEILEDILYDKINYFLLDSLRENITEDPSDEMERNNIDKKNNKVAHYTAEAIIEFCKQHSWVDIEYILWTIISDIERFVDEDIETLFSDFDECYTYLENINLLEEKNFPERIEEKTEKIKILYDKFIGIDEYEKSLQHQKEWKQEDKELVVQSKELVKQFHHYSLQDLDKLMAEALEDEEFEKAAEYRDEINKRNEKKLS